MVNSFFSNVIDREATKVPYSSVHSHSMNSAPINSAPCSSFLQLQLQRYAYIASQLQLTYRHIACTQLQLATSIRMVPKFQWGKTLANRSLQSFGKENVGEYLQQLTLATLVNLEFGWVKYWRMVFAPPNSPKFSPAKICAIQYSYLAISKE